MKAVFLLTLPLLLSTSLAQAHDRGDRIDARFDRIGARREARFDRRH
ncbi:MAG: hypothetical protein ABIW30_07515 [Arenimonas sp.]